MSLFGRLDHHFCNSVQGLFDSRVNEQRADEWDLPHHWRCSITFACLWLDGTDWRAFLLYHISAMVTWWKMSGWTACCEWLTLLFHRTASTHACMHTNIRHLVPLLVFHKPPATRLHEMGEVKKILTPFTACPINSRVYTALLLTWQNWSRPAEPQRTKKFITLLFRSRFVVLNQQILETVSKYANGLQRLELRFAGRFAKLILRIFPMFMYVYI